MPRTARLPPAHAARALTHGATASDSRPAGSCALRGPRASVLSSASPSRARRLERRRHGSAHQVRWTTPTGVPGISGAIVWRIEGGRLVSSDRETAALTVALELPEGVALHPPPSRLRTGSDARGAVDARPPGSLWSPRTTRPSTEYWFPSSAPASSTRPSVIKRRIRVLLTTKSL